MNPLTDMHQGGIASRGIKMNWMNSLGVPTNENDDGDEKLSVWQIVLIFLVVAVPSLTYLFIFLN